MPLIRPDLKINDRTQANWNIMVSCFYPQLTHRRKTLLISNTKLQLTYHISTSHTTSIPSNKEKCSTEYLLLLIYIFLPRSTLPSSLVDQTRRDERTVPKPSVTLMAMNKLGQYQFCVPS